MKTTLRIATLTSAAAAMLAACSSAPDADDEMAKWEEDPRLGEQVNRICFADNIDSFRKATRNTVIVEEGVNDEYLIVTAGSCYDLDNALSLSLDTFGSSSCVSRGDNIFAYDSAFGPDETDIPPVRCPIRAIYEWDEDAAEAEVETSGQ